MLQTNSFNKSFRLLNKNDFQNLKIDSRFFVCGIFVFYYKKNSKDQSRIDIAVSKKFGKANKRNLLKRKVREFFRHSEFKNEGIDILVSMNYKKIKNLKYEDVFNSVDVSLKQAFARNL